MRLQTLKLEDELWPDGETDDPSVEPLPDTPAEQQVDPAEDDGVDPYNTGRFDTKKI